ncbi:hypothetical protein FG379_002553 [Cryptosporidium bovis]|uniref:uncharacterized protein n=1 Tax=Cryptosporidium bovis TaxID=310047 RepID=UPI00351A33EF|nr:hypothetical protein FG379_002553 [Cryptosporidium bovis]
MSSLICPEIRNPSSDLESEGCMTLKPNLVAINCFGTDVDLSNIIFSSGYTPLRFIAVSKGFLLLYYSDPFTAIMAAWFFEIKGIPTATLTGWSLFRICGPTTTNEIIRNFPFRRQCVSFCKHKGTFSWIAIHGIHSRESIMKSIRDKGWSIIETLNDRNFLDVIEMMEMCSVKETIYLKTNLEYLFVKFLEKKSTNSICFIQSTDQFKCQQKLILLSRCSRLPTNIESNSVILPKEVSKKTVNQFDKYSLLAIRKCLYNIPIFLEACLPNNSLSTLKTEYYPSVLGNKPQSDLLGSTYLPLHSKGEIIENTSNKNNSKKYINTYDIFVCMLRVVFIEIINQLKSRIENGNKYPSISEIKKVWLDRFGIEADIFCLLHIAGLNEEFSEIYENVITNCPKKTYPLTKDGR